MRSYIIGIYLYLLIQLEDLGECCKLPQRVRTEPGHQTHFEVEVKHFMALVSCIV